MCNQDVSRFTKPIPSVVEALNQLHSWPQLELSFDACVGGSLKFALLLGAGDKTCEEFFYGVDLHRQMNLRRIILLGPS